MPKVPLYESQVQTRALPTPMAQARPSADAMGGAVGEGLQHLGAGLKNVADVAHQAQMEAEDYRAEMADLEYGRAINQHLYDKQSGFLNKTGMDGLDNAPTLQSLSKRREEIGKSLGPRALERFQMRAMARDDQASSQMERHSADQRIKVYADTADGQMQLGIETAGLQYNDPKAVNSAIEKALVGPDGEPGPLRRLLLAKGAPPEKIEAEENAYRAEGYAAALQGYISKGDGAGAKAYFETVKDRLGAQRHKFEGTVVEMARAQEADETTDAVILGATDPETGWVDASKAESAVREIAVGPTRNEVAKRVKERVALAEQLRDKAGEEKYEQALSVYHTSGKTLNARGLIPIKQWLLNPKNQAAHLWHRLEQADEQSKNMTRSERDRTDDRAIIEFMAKPERERADLNVAKEFGGRVSKEGLDRLTRYKNEASARVEKGDAIDDKDFNATLDDTVQKVSNLRGNKGETAAFRAHMNRWRVRYRDEHKREPGLKEIDEAMARKLEWGEETSGFIHSNKLRFQAEDAGEPFQTFPPDEQRYPGSREVPAPSTAPAKGTKPDKVTRVRQLRTEGKNIQETTRILNQEGY